MQIIYTNKLVSSNHAGVQYKQHEEAWRLKPQWHSAIRNCHQLTRSGASSRRRSQAARLELQEYRKAEEWHEVVRVDKSGPSLGSTADTLDWSTVTWQIMFRGGHGRPWKSPFRLVFPPQGRFLFDPSSSFLCDAGRKESPATFFAPSTFLRVVPCFIRSTCLGSCWPVSRTWLARAATLQTNVVDQRVFRVLTGRGTRLRRNFTRILAPCNLDWQQCASIHPERSKNGRRILCNAAVTLVDADSSGSPEAGP